MYDRGRAQLLLHDYADAEYSFRRKIFINLSITRMPLLEHLAHFHLGEIYEGMGRRDDAIREYKASYRITPSLAHACRRSRKRAPR
jgi:tetratricopeptide (TPR) repeat protein